MPDDLIAVGARGLLSSSAHDSACATVLLADAQRLFRQGLAALLHARPGWRVVGEAADAGDAVRLAAAVRPHLALVDAALPPGGVADALLELRAASAHTSIVVLTAYANDELHDLAPVTAWVPKTASFERLLEAMRAPAHVGATPRTPPSAALSPREREVLRGLARGSRTREIAAALAISPKTVETYRSRLTTKLGIDDLAGLVRYAIRTGQVSADR